eukprot:14439493-Alexandrium_andersonii.AAC.1
MARCREVEAHLGGHLGVPLHPDVGRYDDFEVYLLPDYARTVVRVLVLEPMTAVLRAACSAFGVDAQQYALLANGACQSSWCTSHFPRSTCSAAGVSF